MKHFFCLLSAILFTATSQAQKLPNVQEKPLRAPVNVKIDGKADEWTGLLQAKNSATELTYAISNDDVYLYLVFQASVPEVYRKAMMAGVSISINRTGKKDDKDAISVAYPLFERGQRPAIQWGIGGRGVTLTDEQTAQKKDSLLQVNNGKVALAKWISVRGIPAVDSLMSVYNDEGFKAANQFDRQQVYTCEMAIALKHLGITAKDAAKFTYHVALNGGPNKAKAPIVYGATLANGEPMPAAQFEAAQNRLAAAYATTDFWGEYTLAPKP